MQPIDVYMEDVKNISEKEYLDDGDLKILRWVAKDWVEREQIIRDKFPQGLYEGSFKMAIDTHAAMSKGSHCLVSMTYKNSVGKD